MKTVVLLTDYGTRDWYAKVLSGVILQICPEAQIIDLTHQVPAGNVVAGSFILENAYSHFPTGTVFVCVVDPGVGSSRASLAVRTSRYTFLAPDNGLLSHVLSREEPLQAHRIENTQYMLQPLSKTFHGRDVYAPVAAHLLQGAKIEELGPEQEELNILPWPGVVSSDYSVRGEILYIDHFGNCITSIMESDLNELPKGELEVMLQSGERIHIGDFYQQTPMGQPMALIGSGHYLEVSVNGGHAGRSLSLRVGDVVQVQVITDDIGG